METTLLTGSATAVKRWLDQAYQEYLGLNVLAKYFGTSETSMIQVNEDLMKNKGDSITFNRLGALTGEGVQGDSVLEGNEEDLPYNSQAVTIDLYRNATKVAGKMTEQRFPFEIANKSKPALTQWKAHKDEREIFRAMGSIDGVLYNAASEAQKDAWLANNADRVLFGAAVANNVANDHSACLLTVDGTADVLLPAHLTLLKRLAKLGNPKIQPLKIGEAGMGMEVYVYFAHPYCTRDLKASDDWKNANRDAMPRGSENPIFTGAIGSYDGVIVVESDKIPLLDNVGAGSIDVAQNFLCGAQAILWAQGSVGGGQRVNFVDEKFDYGNKTAVAIESMWGVAKARFGTGPAGVSKDHGIVTSYVAAVAD